MSQVDHDVVVVGAGHNGLVSAAYLAKAGLDVLVLEARDTVGGCSSTVDGIGARVNICLCDHLLIRTTPIVEELDLGAHGLRYIDVDPHHLFLSWDGAPSWFAFTSLEKTLDSLAVAFPGAVDGYRNLMHKALPAARLVLDLACSSPTPASAVRSLARMNGKGPAALFRWRRETARQVLERFIPEPAVVGSLLIDAPSTWGVPPDHPGTGLAVLSAAIRHLATPGRPVGGSGALPAALASAVAQAGGRVRCGAAVDRILVEGKAVRGVRLADGEEITARMVVAAADPRRLFVDWLGGSVPIPPWVPAVAPEGYEAKLDVVLDRLPTYRGVEALGHGVADPLVPTGAITPGTEGITRAHAAMTRGMVSDQPVMYANWPSVTDPTMVVEGEHLLGLEVLFTPYHLEGGWAGSGEPERWLQAFSALVEPGFLDSVKRWRLVSPVTYETEFGLERGYVPGYAGGPVAALMGRPKELTRYVTSVRGLYVTGGGTFPGAGIWGASGRNVATRILRDV